MARKWIEESIYGILANKIILVSDWTRNSFSWRFSTTYGVNSYDYLRMTIQSQRNLFICCWCDWNICQLLNNFGCDLTSKANEDATGTFRRSRTSSSLTMFKLWFARRISIRNTIELRARETKEHSRLRPKTSKALMRHTILVKHIYCAIYFISLCAFRKLRHFTAKERNTIFSALFFLFCCS